MNVYPVNALEACAMASVNKEVHSNIKDLYNRYISYQVDFDSSDIEVTGAWRELIDTDVFIIGNTNGVSANIKYLYNTEIVFEKEFSIENYIEIIEIKNSFDILQKKKINKFILTMSTNSNENAHIGYIYVGETWRLPRFVVSPREGLELRNDSDRTFSGQVTGIPIETLRNFAVEFARIDNKTKKKFDDYANGVQTIIPHVIDFYPEAHEEFQPVFGTLESYGDKEKRNENNFYWNFSANWKESK